MEARFIRPFITTALISVVWLGLACAAPARAAGYKTANFTVSAPTAELAKEIGDQAEVYRRQLAVEWLGQELPRWSKPCPIHANVKPGLGAGGATSFIFDRGEVFGWRMNIQGSRERILDSVLPHEITHTIFASYFRQPLPRWADEGACTTVEHRSEVAKQERMLIQFLKTGRGIAFSEMFAMKEYPSDVMPLYSQGHSLAQWLIENRGRKVFLEFLADGMQDENWPRAVQQYYGFNGLSSMQNSWLDWVKAGRPQITPETSPMTQLASHTSPKRSDGSAEQAILRTQSPDDITPVAAADHKSDETKSAAVTVASASGSVYAQAAARAERERRTDASPSDTRAKSPGPSIYDASVSTGVIRR
jgi:hypothetical protein